MASRASRIVGLTVGALAAAAALTATGTAEAGVHFGGHFGGSVHVGGGGSHWGGGVHVSGGGGYYGGSHWSRPAPVWTPHRWSVGGSIWVGGGYYPRPYYYYQPVPSYYGGSYYPVAVSAGPSTYAAVAPEQELPRFGLGLFAGGISVNQQQSSSDVGVLGRLRLTDGLLVEGELGKTELANGVRVDRRLAASLVYELGAHNALAPFVVGGVGVNQADVGGGNWSTNQNFAEIGGGLRWALSRNLHLTVDFRAGSRQASDTPTSGLTGVARTVAPSPASNDESYTRGRLSAILFF